MPRRTLSGRDVEIDESGFLVDALAWTPEIAEELARETGLGGLTPRHWRVVLCCREAAALYRQVDPNQQEPEGVVNARQLNGKALSYVNILDADAAWSAACDFAEPTVVIVKHMTPCGIASRDDLSEAFGLAFEART